MQNDGRHHEGMVMAFPKTDMARANLPISTPTQILGQLRNWWVTTPGAFKVRSWCSTPSTTGSHPPRAVSICGEPPSFGLGSSPAVHSAVRATRAYRDPSMSSCHPHTPKVYNCFKPQNLLPSSKRSDMSRFCRLFSIANAMRR